ncbi:MAG: dihydrofolate reductase [Sandaracinaceae bacterium]|nr:dihydrofolate reductase [Sandaracinaceae bacterium]
MRPHTTVYCAVSVDGFIAREDGSVDWLEAAGDASEEDYGYRAFVDSVDFLVMGRGTFETVRGFGAWPYTVPVVVLSQTLSPADLAEAHATDARLSTRSPRSLLDELGAEGARRVYVDGGRLVQSFLAEGLIDELILTTIPILLGSGIHLFGSRGREHGLEHQETRAYPSGFVQSRYTVRRSS